MERKLVNQGNLTLSHVFCFCLVEEKKKKKKKKEGRSAQTQKEHKHCGCITREPHRHYKDVLRLSYFPGFPFF
jgi:hypothetical protein